MTPLCHAVSHGRLEATRYLLEKGCDADVRTGSGETPLWLALSRDSWCSSESVSCLIENGCSVDMAVDSGETPLHYAASHGLEYEVELLVDGGCNMKLMTSQGELPLCSAASNGHFRVVKCLLDKGCNIDARDIWGQTALHTALHSGEYEIAKYLIQRGCNIHARDDDGNTAFHHAAFCCSRSCADLLERGLDANAVNYMGESPLMLHLDSELARYASETLYLVSISHASILTRGSEILAKARRNAAESHVNQRQLFLEVCRAIEDVLEGLPENLFYALSVWHLEEDYD
jgi:ankyrin repeat protein